MPRMQILGRVWIIDELVSEDGSRTFVRISPATKPRPTKAEYRAAKAEYRRIVCPADTHLSDQ